MLYDLDYQALIPSQYSTMEEYLGDWGEIITTILIVAFIILFIISLIIVFSDVEGIISTIATIIIVAGVCFGCYIFGGQS